VAAAAAIVNTNKKLSSTSIKKPNDDITSNSNSTTTTTTTTTTTAAAASATISSPSTTTGDLIFGKEVKASKEFLSWCSSSLKSLTNNDNQILIEFLLTLDNNSDVKDYIIETLGNTTKIIQFSEEFIRRKDLENFSATAKVKISSNKSSSLTMTTASSSISNTVASNPWATLEKVDGNKKSSSTAATSSSSPSSTTKEIGGGGGSKKKGKKVVDPSVLGFQ
jgi:hypothetical protein